MKALIRGANIVITLMLVGVATGLVLVVLPIFGNRALIVRSASMGPTIPVGSLVAVEPKTSLLSPQPASLAPKYNAGNVIAFRNETSPKIITTHRIVGTKIKNGEVFYQTKGDANNAPDNQLVAEKDVIGTTWFSIPFIGKLFAFTKSNIGFPLLVIFPAFLVIIFETINIYKEFKKQRLAYQNQFSPNIGVSGLKILLPLIVSVLVIQNSFAFFSDIATSTNNVFTAGQCFGSGNNIVINEVFYDVDTAHNGQGSENNWEWVELFNPTGSTVILTGWSIEDGNASDPFPGAPSLPPCSFAIVSPSNESQLKDQSNNGGRWTIQAGTVFVTLSSAIGNGLNNGGDKVILKNGSGSEVDKMSYGSDKTGFISGCTPTACPSVATGHSLERNPDGFDTDSASDFVDRTTPTPGS